MQKLPCSPLFRRAMPVLATVACLHLLSAALVDKRMQYKEISFASQRLSPSLDGYTIAFLTDLHVCPETKLRRIVHEVNRRGVDLVLLGGDYAGQPDLRRCMKKLSGIRSPDGIFGVQGNHDNRRKLRAAMKDAGLVLLENTGHSVRDNLYLAGVTDLRRGGSNLHAAFAGASAHDFVLLLTHNPDVAMQPGIGRADLSLAGHTHGGVVTLFGAWSPAMYRVSRYGQRFRCGWCATNAGTEIFVSRGVGVHHPLMPRVFARPQVIYLTLRAGDNEEMVSFQ